MKKGLLQISLILVLSGLGLTLKGQNVTFLSNLSQTVDPSPPVLGLNQYLAAPFITGGSPATFSSATVNLFASQFSTGHVQFGLFSDANGLPGSQLPGGALNGPSSMYANGNYLYSASVPLFLSPNTQYWLVGTGDYATPNANYGWYDTYSYAYSSSAGWQLPGIMAFSGDEGATWTSDATALIPRPLRFQITGSVVPEPSVLMLGIFGVSALLLLRWRTRGVGPIQER